MIEYKKVDLPIRDSDSEGICKELNKLGKDDWLLVSPLHRVDGNSLVCIMARDLVGAIRGRNYEKENDAQKPSIDVSALNTPTAVGDKTVTSAKEQCEHEWVSDDNEVVSGTEVCLRCGNVRPKQDDWRGQARLLGIPLYHRKKEDVLADIEKAKNET